MVEQPCRACGHTQLSSVLDLGAMHLSGFPSGMEQPKRRAPLDFCQCPSCKLVQLRHTVAPDEMFKHYWYKSGVNESMLVELKDVIASGARYVGGLAAGDIVMDIGANDGTLLSQYDEHVTRVAYEPATNLQASLQPHCEVLRPDYFPGAQPESVALCSSLQGKVKVITSIACFYAVEDPMEFIGAVNRLLSPDGVWIVQFQDLYQMLQTTAFDDICHEHLFYPSLASTERMLAPFDLVLFDAQQRDINGGSLRLCIGRRHRQVEQSVPTLREREAGCEGQEMLNGFARCVLDARTRIRETVLSAVSVGKTVDLYGASTKGNTLLQFCDLGPGLIRRAWERSEGKWGRRTVTGIPIVSEQEGRENPPDILFVVIWQFREVILQREADYLSRGGQFLFPLPTVELVRAESAA